MEIKSLQEPIEARNLHLAKSNFVSVTLGESRCEDAGLQSVRFGYVSMSGAFLADIDLAGGAIRNANLSGVHIGNCTVAGLCVDGVLPTGLLAAYRKAA